MPRIDTLYRISPSTSEGRQLQKSRRVELYTRAARVRLAPPNVRADDRKSR